MSATAWRLLAAAAAAYSLCSMLFADWPGAFAEALAGLGFFAIARSSET